MTRQSLEQQSPLDVMLSLGLSRMTANVLQIAMELDAFGKLAGQQLSLAETSALWGLPVPSARVLAQWLCGVGLLLYRHGKLSNSPLGEALTGDPLTETGFRLFLDVGSSAEEVRRTLKEPPVQIWYQVRDSDRAPQQADPGAKEFYRDYHPYRVRWGEELVLRYNFSRHRVLLDIGGASGGWCLGVRKRFSHLRCILFDLPFVCQIAEEIIAEAGEAQGIQTAAGSFFTDELPSGADVALLANVLHDWTVEDGRRILRRVRDALPAGGVLLVSEYYLEDDWSGGVGLGNHQAYSVLGAEGKGGWQPSYEEMETLLRDAEFAEVERRPNLVIAVKPSA